MLTPVNVATQLTSGELAFVEKVADHSYADGELIIGNGSTGSVSIATLTAGTNVTITNDHGAITIAASGSGGGITIATPSGTVNGSNANFTTIATPLYVVADGLTYFAGAGYSFSTSTITMDLAPSQFIRYVY